LLLSAAVRLQRPHLLAAKLRRADIDASAGAVEETARIDGCGATLLTHWRQRWGRSSGAAYALPQRASQAHKTGALTGRDNFNYGREPIAFSVYVLNRHQGRPKQHDAIGHINGAAAVGLDDAKACKASDDQ